MDKAMVLDLARLACGDGAAFDVTHEADGSMRCSLYPQSMEDRMAKTVKTTQSLTAEQYDRLRHAMQADTKDHGLRHG